MDMNNVNIEEIVKQVLSGMTGNAPAQTAAPAAQTPAAPAILRKNIWNFRSTRFRKLEMMTSSLK